MYGYLNCQESSHVYAEHRNRLVIGRRFWNSRCVVRHMYFYSTRSTTVLNDWRNGWRAAGVCLSDESLAALQHAVSELRLRVRARTKRIKALAGHIGSRASADDDLRGSRSTREINTKPSRPRLSERSQVDANELVGIARHCRQMDVFTLSLIHGTLGYAELPVADLVSTVCTRSIVNDNKIWRSIDSLLFRRPEKTLEHV